MSNSFISKEKVRTDAEKSRTRTIKQTQIPTQKKPPAMPPVKLPKPPKSSKE